MHHCWVSLGVRRSSSGLVKRCNMKAKTASRASPVAGVLLESKSQTQVGFEVGLVTSRSKQGQSRDGLPRGSGNWGPSLYSKDVCLIDTWHVKEVALDRPSQTPLCQAETHTSQIFFGLKEHQNLSKSLTFGRCSQGAHCVAKVSPWKGSSALSMG